MPGRAPTDVQAVYVFKLWDTDRVPRFYTSNGWALLRVLFVRTGVVAT